MFGRSDLLHSMRAAGMLHRPKPAEM
jgi:hypothetical protein